MKKLLLSLTLVSAIFAHAGAQSCLGIINTIAGNGTSGHAGDGGPATAAEIDFNYGLAADGAGNVYVADPHYYYIRKINATGIITSVAGTGISTYSGDGGPSTTAAITTVGGIATDAAGNIYFSDQGSQRIRKIDVSGVITTVAGTGTSGYNGDGIAATAANIEGPWGVAVDGAGNLYFSEDAGARVRKVDPSGIITTIAGTGVHGYSGDNGPATAAQINQPSGIAVDGSGNVYITMPQNQIIRKVDVYGTITTYAGSGVIGYAGDGGPATNAKFVYPFMIAADAANNLYIADYNNYRIRVVNPSSGIISTFVGSTAGFSGDGGPATAAQMELAGSVATDPSGNLYINDYANWRIRKVTINNTSPVFTGGHSQGITVCPNSTANSIDALMSINDPDISQSETWSLASGPSHGTVSAAYTGTATGGILTTTGLYYTPAPGFAGTDIFQVNITDCAGGTDMTTVTVSVTAAISAGTITGPPGVCIGAAITLSDPVSGGVWGSSNGNATVSGGVITGVSAGVDTISYIVTGSCTSATAKSIITVNPLPAGIIGLPDVCAGATNTLSDPSGGGNWSSPGFSGIVSVSVLTGNVTGVATGTAIITYTLPTGCTTTAPITVITPPSAITGHAAVCEGATIPLSDAVAGGAWSTADYTAAIDAGTGVVTGISAGPATVSYSLAAGCAVTKIITVNPAPDPITGVSDMCAGGATMDVYDADTSAGTWTSTFVTISRTGVVSSYDAGVGIITYTLPGGCYTTASFTVDPLPSFITGPGAVCTGLSIALSDSVSGGLWSTTDATAGIAAGSGVATGLLAGGATVTYTLPTGCYMTDIITVYAMPAAITGATGLCAGATTLLNDTTGGGAWNTTGSIAAVSGTGLVTGVSAGTAVISYTIGGLCTAMKTVTITPLPVVFGVTGGGSFCAGGAGVHVLLSGSAAGIRYTLYNSGIVADSLNGSGSFLDYGTETTAGFYTIVGVNATTGCSSSMAGSAVVSVTPVVAPAVSISETPPDSVCAGTPVALAAVPVNGGLSPAYQWKVNGVTVGSGSGYSFDPANGDVVTLTLISDATCAMPSAVDTFITMGVVTPVTPDVTISAAPGLNIAKGQDVTLSASVTNGGTSPTYQWQVSGANVAGANAPTYTINNLLANEMVSCIVTSSGTCNIAGKNQSYVTVNDDAVGAVVMGEELTLTPNPNKGEFRVSGSLGSINDEEATLEITDMVGRVIYTHKVTAINGNLDEMIILGNTIANGTYLLHVRSATGNKVFHIIVTQ